MKAIRNTDFQFTGQTQSYHGKVRDMYTIGDDLMVAVVSDRISVRRGHATRHPLRAKSSMACKAFWMRSKTLCPLGMWPAQTPM